tara:strand:+ start:239 stop:424 length:186 start_codon:yes stop_codon:yes gene_type:complete
MTNYEVRTTQTIVRYYRVKAKSEESAIDKVKNDEGLLEHTMLREKVYDYAVQLSPEGEVII